jgi:hypothetical protein
VAKSIYAKGQVALGKANRSSRQTLGRPARSNCELCASIYYCVSFGKWDSLTELRRQLAYSVKMFRQGIISGDPGIEYLCKFSALEGLVCGSQTKNKINV